MAFDRTLFDNSGTDDGAESRPVDLPSQQIVSDGLVQALKEGRRGIFLLGAESAGAGKSTILNAAIESMGCFTVWIRPDEYALDAQLNPKRIVRNALREACDESPVWFDRFANQFLARVFALGLRAGLIPSHDAEAWARAMEASPHHYLSGQDGAKLLRWLADDKRSTLRYQLVLRLLSSDHAVFDEVDEATAWLDFFLSGKSGASAEWQSRPCSRFPADSSASVEWLARWIDLGNTAFAGEDVKFTRQTLALVNAAQTVVCLLDQIDGVMGRPSLARELAGMALDWMNCTSMVVIAVNRDVWETGFLPVLPEAWSDRLSACSEWLGNLEVPELELLLKAHSPDAPEETSLEEWSKRRGQGGTAREGLRFADSLANGAVESTARNDFLVFSEELTTENLVESRRGIFLDAGDRLPFVTVESEDADDQRMGRLRWNTPEHVAWIGLAEPNNAGAWRAFFASFAATSVDEGSVKLVVPVFDGDSESAIRAYAAIEGLDPSLDAISWLNVSRLTPAGWWRPTESRNRTMDSFLDASPLWNAITEPVIVNN